MLAASHAPPQSFLGRVGHLIACTRQRLHRIESRRKSPWICPQCGNANAWLMTGKLNKTGGVWSGAATLKCVAGCGLEYMWRP